MPRTSWELWPSQSTRKSPAGAPATAGISCLQVAHELTRNGTARGVTAHRDAAARPSTPPIITAFLIEIPFLCRVCDTFLWYYGIGWWGVGPLTPPCPLSPTALPTPGREGVTVRKRS